MSNTTPASLNKHLCFLLFLVLWQDTSHPKATAPSVNVSTPTRPPRALQLFFDAFLSLLSTHEELDILFKVVILAVVSETVTVASETVTVASETAAVVSETVVVLEKLYSYYSQSSTCKTFIILICAVWKCWRIKICQWLDIMM